MFSPRLYLAVIALSSIAVALAEGEEDAPEATHENETLADEPYIPMFLRNRLNSNPRGGSPSLSGVKGGTQSVKGGRGSSSRGIKIGKQNYSGVKTGVKTSRVNAGGSPQSQCGSEPKRPDHASQECSKYSGCRVTCNRGYEFANGRNQVMVTCQDGVWKVGSTEWAAVSTCIPICSPECQNGGICVEPNQCNCQENYSGPQCQFKDEPCLNEPPPTFNARRRCNSHSCTITCYKNHTFPDGTGITNLLCKNGNWVPTHPDWVTVPDCQAVCSPPCQNGGNCLALDMCQCPENFRGPQCQYSVDACDVSKLGFNGGYSCSGDGEKFACELNCPNGIEFESIPASVYTCLYSEGVFKPQPVPQCKIESNMRIIPAGEWSSSHHKTTDYSWSSGDQYGSNYGTNSRGGSKTGVKGHSGKSYGEGGQESGNMGHGQDGTFGNNQGHLIVIETKRPEPSVCFTWGGVHYKTFDGKIFSFESDCAHTLVRDSEDGLFTITTTNSPGCRTGDATCFRIVKIFLQGKEYTLTLSDEGLPEFRTKKKALTIPGQLPGVRIEMSAHFMVVTLDSIGASLKWDGGLLVQVQASESLWNRTAGLCGNMNGDNTDDLTSTGGAHPKSIATLASSWRAQNIGETCDEYPNIEHSCNARADIADEASRFCSTLLADRRFQVCSSVMDLSSLETACRWDYCGCKNENKKKCACDTMSVYVRQCAYKGIITKMEWRDDATCPMKCSGGRVYMSCGPKTQASCGAQTETKSGGDGICEEGCFCPEGSVLHDGKCISREECPCKLRGKFFHPGASTSRDCNTCTCSSGKWVCTEAKCSARCAAIGDPHYSTFDGKRYDFMGKCTYYLVKGGDYSIEGENVACPGAISENMAFTSTLSDAPSCTKTVTIRVKDVTIKLKQNRELLVNGEEVTKLPILSGGVEVRVASSIFIIAKLPNGIEVWWDGISRVYINAPAEFHGKTKGLCGTFTMNQKDDFATPDGDVEQSVIPFANKWKTDESCPDAPKKEPTHPCEINPQKRVQAETYCSKIHSQLFSDCHWHVDPEPFYKDCMYDMCACETDINLCLCPILAAYGKECAHQGLQLSWRHEIDHCKVHCPGGQTYQVCGNSCTRSCGDISFDPSCRKDCVEGCNCPEGQTLDERNECIPIGQCPCQHAGLEFKAGYREVRPGTKSQELCTCASGIWNCLPATREEIDDYPAAADLKSVCSAAGNQELSTCLPVEPKTCRNMMIAVTQSPAICKPGCVCKKNYVLDVPSGKCVKEDQCPCYHGGKSYKEGSSMQEECNTCKCNNGKWKCTDRICDGVCSAWGDSHYTTFDGKLYEFQGICDYVLAKGTLSPEETFDVSTQNVPCGTTGVTCSKSITLVVGKGENQETITLTKGKELPEGSFKRIAIRRAGLFVFLDVPDLGLVVQWDEGTRVYLRLNPRWQGRTKGLCGDYNNNAEDDFKTPSGGISEVSANLFGDSWKKQTSCPESKEITDTCLANLERQTWAKKKCGLLKSPLFQACHSEVEVEPYLDRCVFDTCGCDVGGDCECLCTALAAYAQECNSRGVPVKWRSQKLCPMQCDENCSTYSPCISTCPRETCDNLVVIGDKSHLCGADTCVEGCLPKACPEGEIYQTANYSECVPRATCKPVCMTIDEVTYYEGDAMESDDCHSCFCSRGKKTCTGQPCPTTPRPITTVPMEEQHECIDGWTAWVNKDLPVKGKKVSDVEPLPMTLDLYGIKGSAVCTKDLMVDIRCRSVDGHLTPKETGLNVECSLERGLYCTAQRNERPCVDFEISVLCKCSETPETTTELTTTTTSTTIAPPKYSPCDVAKPNQPHPKDCHAFYQCVPGLEGPELVEKSCGPDMLYNPNSQVCDWPATVTLLRPECDRTPPTTVPPSVITTTAPCKDGEVWSECAVQCSRACRYYEDLLIERGICNGSKDCVPGCVPADKVECPPHKLWRDDRTCVNVADCTCRTHDNKSIKPGVPVKESECEICQCLRNVYTCDNSLCRTTPEPTEGPTTVAPETPVLCNRSNLTYLVNGQVPLPDEAFKASGYSEDIHKPLNARLSNNTAETSGGAWEPEEMDQKQWISVDLGNPETVFGVILQGNPSDNKYVKTYNVYYSPNEDDESFEPVTASGSELPKIFHGPEDTTSVKQALFDKPFIAQKIKIAPKTWHRGIALRFEVIGCDNLTSNESGRNRTRTPEVEVNKTVISAGLPTGPTPISNYTFVVTTPVPMLEECAVDNYENIIYNVTFDASSVSSPRFAAKNAKLDNQASDFSGGSWEPADTNDEQWLDIKLPEPEPIYGVIIQGSPGEDKYVTSYKVLYSEDGVRFSYIVDKKGEHQVFSGSVDQIESAVQIFYYPIEAKVVRINPHTWHKGIAMRAELIGCRTDNLYSGSTRPPVDSAKHLEPTDCNDPMGLEDSMMSDQQISASSTLDDSLPNIRISADGIWRPKYDNPNQFVEFDFYEPRNLTGVETKGYNNIWTKSYKVLYSHDRRQWNPVTDGKGRDRNFYGNFDDKKSKVNHFERPIQARYLRIQPTTWNQHVGLKAEIRGCFLPYPVVTTPTPVTSTTPRLPSKCNVCEGIAENSDDNCKCDGAGWWDGSSCVTKQECPCVIGHLTYVVGSVYETEDCQQCTCTLGGASSCVEKKCEPCKTPGQRSVQTELCSCVCKPCPIGTRLCPRSNICINESSWCNGVEDCLDDETDCAVTPTPPPPPTIHEVSQQTCQQPTCPAGYKVVLKSKRYVEVIGMLRTASSRGVKGGVKGGAKGGVKGSVKGGSLSSVKGSRLSDAAATSEDMECPEYSCVSTKPPPPFGFIPLSQTQCPKEICPPGYKVVLERMNLYYPDACPRYRCKPPPPREAVCNVIGRTFNTFDKLEYKYDICNHLLARELESNKWYITLEKRCNKLGNLCEKVLVIMFDDKYVYLYPDLHIDINEYTYSPNQVKQLTDTNKAFEITRVGNTLRFVSYHYGFWVIWDMNSNAKIGVTTKLAGHVDGLCGYYDGYSGNDKRLPDGEQARRTVDFGNSWALEDTPECEPQVCPQHVQEEAWNICNTVKQRSLAVCSGVLDLEKFVSRCLENVCTCLRGNLSASECRCRELTAFVSECQAADPSIDLSTWRTTHDCPISCPAPFVHKDCFRYKCESTCNNLQEIDPCPVMPGVCFSGCFCPDGTVRRGEECVLPTECRDCLCDGFGNSKFVSFDRNNYTFSGNCTYVLSRDITNDIKGGKPGHTYQVLVTNVACPAGVCTEAITVLYQKHSIQIKQGHHLKELIVFVDGKSVSSFPHKTKWLTLEEAPGRDITLLIPAIQLEIASFQHNFAFMVRLPSHTFGGAMEGLCGDCNENIADDMRRRDGQIVNDATDFGNSWLVNDAPPNLNISNEKCISTPEKECVTRPSETSPCDRLMNAKIFGQCYEMVDSEPYLEMCRQSLCDGDNVCDVLEAYARSCLQAGLCPSWRTDDVCPYKCPSHLEYRACGYGCRETCSDIESGRQVKCTLGSTEGCFCPEDKILVNDTCVSKKQCLVCDEEGHIEGDEWHPDKCTTCHCNKKVVTCEKTECPALETICAEGLTPIPATGTEDPCCSKYLCIPITTTTPTCVEQQQPVCGNGQIMKTVTGSDGCQKFICECIPAEECPPISTETLEPGMVEIRNTSGCCPWSTFVCKPETCPKPTPCKEFYEPKSVTVPGHCCPSYECKLQPNVCTYTPEFTAGTKSKAGVSYKKLGEKWQDGPCTSCECEKVADGHEAKCVTTKCPTVETHPDVNEFVIEAVLPDGECCSTFKRIACKDQSNTYAVGEEWQPDLSDACKKMECINETLGVQKQVKLQECDKKCELGYEYREPEDKGAKCCGECIPVACVIDGKLKNIGEEWRSNDYCNSYSCSAVNGSLQVRTVTETCTKIDDHENEEFEIEVRPVEGKCCPEKVVVGCRYNGVIHKPGEKWISPNDACLTEMCIDTPKGVAKKQELKTCNKQCALGWEYQEPERDECCGECKQLYCVDGDILRKPEATWSSADNCTTFECLNFGDQFQISASKEICPDVTACAKESIYVDGCCKRCNITSLNQQVGCAAEVVPSNVTVELVQEIRDNHGLCKNFNPIEGLTACQGRCKSSTYLNKETFAQESDCKCCAPMEYKQLVVELTCIDGAKLKKALNVPKSCTCEPCLSDRGTKKGRKTAVKTGGLMTN